MSSLGEGTVPVYIEYLQRDLEMADIDQEQGDFKTIELFDYFVGESCFLLGMVLNGPLGEGWQLLETFQMDVSEGLLVG